MNGQLTTRDIVSAMQALVTVNGGFLHWSVTDLMPAYQ